MIKKNAAIIIVNYQILDMLRLPGQVLARVFKRLENFTPIQHNNSMETVQALYTIMLICTQNFGTGI